MHFTNDSVRFYATNLQLFVLWIPLIIINMIETQKNLGIRWKKFFNMGDVKMTSPAFLGGNGAAAVLVLRP